MGKKENCDPSTRKTILALYESDWSFRKIADYLKCSKTKVFNAVNHFKKFNTTNNVLRKPKSRKTTPLEDALIVRSARADPSKSSEIIRREVFGSGGVSTRTIRRRISDAKLFGGIARRVPLLKKKSGNPNEKANEIKIKVEEQNDDDGTTDTTSEQEPLVHEDEIKEEITINEDFKESIPLLLESVKTEQDPLANIQDQINFDHDYNAPISTQTDPPISSVSSTWQESTNPTMLIGPIPTSQLPSHSDLCLKSSLIEELKNVTIRLQQEVALNATQKRNIEALKRKVKELHGLLTKRDQQIKSLKSQVRILKTKR